jgi:hypothetical protein
MATPHQNEAKAALAVRSSLPGFQTSGSKFLLRGAPNTTATISPHQITNKNVRPVFDIQLIAGLAFWVAVAARLAESTSFQRRYFQGRVSSKLRGSHGAWGSEKVLALRTSQERSCTRSITAS